MTLNNIRGASACSEDGKKYVREQINHRWGRELKGMLETNQAFSTTYTQASLRPHIISKATLKWSSETKSDHRRSPDDKRTSVFSSVMTPGGQRLDVDL